MGAVNAVKKSERVEVFPLYSTIGVDSVRVCSLLVTLYERKRLNLRVL